MDRKWYITILSFCKIVDKFLEKSYDKFIKYVEKKKIEFQNLVIFVKKIC